MLDQDPDILSGGLVAKTPQKKAPQPRANVDEIVERHAKRTGLDPNLLRAVMGQESRGNPRAVSPKGARGLMQLMPGTAARFGVKNIRDPEQNIRGGADYLKFLHDRFNGNTDLMLAAYNAGEGAVDKFGGIPPYKETRNYVPGVKARYDSLSKADILKGGLVAKSQEPKLPPITVPLPSAQQPPPPQIKPPDYGEPSLESQIAAQEKDVAAKRAAMEAAQANYGQKGQQPTPPIQPAGQPTGQRLSERNRAAITRPRKTYNTSLTPDEEGGFQKWKEQYAPQDSGQDYDLRGAYKAGLTPDPKTGHWPDTFKKPNHPTFSDQSQYAVSAAAERAGHWDGDTFVPPSLVSKAIRPRMADPSAHVQAITANAPPPIQLTQRWKNTSGDAPNGFGAEFNRQVQLKDQRAAAQAASQPQLKPRTPAMKSGMEGSVSIGSDDLDWHFGPISEAEWNSLSQPKRNAIIQFTERQAAKDEIKKQRGVKLTQSLDYQSRNRTHYSLSPLQPSQAPALPRVAQIGSMHDLIAGVKQQPQTANDHARDQLIEANYRELKSQQDRLQQQYRGAERANIAFQLKSDSELRTQAGDAANERMAMEAYRPEIDALKKKFRDAAVSAAPNQNGLVAGDPRQAVRAEDVERVLNSVWGALAGTGIQLGNLAQMVTGGRRGGGMVAQGRMAQQALAELDQEDPNKGWLAAAEKTLPGAAIEAAKMTTAGRALGAATLPTLGALSEIDKGLGPAAIAAGEGALFHKGFGLTASMKPVGKFLTWTAVPSALSIAQGEDPKRAILSNTAFGVMALTEKAPRVRVTDGGDVRDATPADIPRIEKNEIQVVKPEVVSAGELKAEHYSTRQPRRVRNVEGGSKGQFKPGKPAPDTTSSAEQLRRMPDATFVEEWTRPANKQRFPFNDLLAEAKRRGYNADGKQVTPETESKAVKTIDDLKSDQPIPAKAPEYKPVAPPITDSQTPDILDGGLVEKRGNTEEDVYPESREYEDQILSRQQPPNFAESTALDFESAGKERLKKLIEKHRAKSDAAKPSEPLVGKDQIKAEIPTGREGGSKQTPPEKPAPVEELVDDVLKSRQVAGATGIARVPIDQIEVDPQRFQYKIKHDARGATGSLSDVAKWNPNFAGAVAIWRDPANGRDYVVNGHNRYDLAKRTGQTRLDVRYIDAPNAQEARSQGALVNIAEGQGTPLDAAKYFRDSGQTAEDARNQGINLTQKVASQGMALSKLNKFLFNQVIQGDLPEDFAVQIGNKIQSPDLQDQAYKAIKNAEAKGRSLNNGTVEEMLDAINSAPRTSETEQTLFGDITSDRSLFTERAQVASAIKRQLAADKSLFGTAARKSDRLAEGGTKVDVERAKELQASATEALGTFDTLKNRAGGISDILDDGAQQVANGKRPDQVAREAYDKIRNAVRAELGRGVGPDLQGSRGVAQRSEGERGQRALVEAPAEAPSKNSEAGAVAFGDIYHTIKNVIDATRDFVTLETTPKLRRLGASLAVRAREHASARNSTPYVVRDLLAKVFPSEYGDPQAMAKTIDVINKDNILGGYDNFIQKMADAQVAMVQAEAAEKAARQQRRALNKNPPQGMLAKQIAQLKLKATNDAKRAHQAAIDARAEIGSWKAKAEDVEKKHNLSQIDQEVQDALNDPGIVDNIDRWKKHVNPVLDSLYNEMKRMAPNTQREQRGRVFGARVNLLPESRAAEMNNFAKPGTPMPEGFANYRNPNVKKDPYMRAAKFTGEYSTDANAVLTGVLGPRLNEVTKLRLFNSLVNSGSAIELEYGQPAPASIQGEPVKRLPIRVPETQPSGLTKMVEHNLYVRADIAREVRDVLNTDMSLPTNPVAKFLTHIQLAQLTDLTAHIKNIHTVLASAPATRSAWTDALRRLPALGSVDSLGRIVGVTREVMRDTPEIRSELATMAKLGLLRPEYEPTGIQKITRGQQLIHKVDTASRIVMNRFFDNLAEAGRVNDTALNRADFVQQIGEYNRRLMGPLMKAARDSGLSPFVVAGRNFNRQSVRLLTGNPGVEASSHTEAAKMRAVNMVSGLVAAAVIPALLNTTTTGSLGGRPGTPIGAWDLGKQEDEKGRHKVIDLMQILGIRRGLRATGANALVEGLREGKSWNEIAGDAVENVTQTAAHPWMGPALGFSYASLTGRRLDLRGGPEAPQALNVGGGGRQIVENTRTALEGQNPLIYGLASPLFKDEKDDSYLKRIGQGLVKGPRQALGVQDLQSPAQKVLGDEQRERGAFSRTLDSAKAANLRTDLRERYRQGQDIQDDLDQAVEKGTLSPRQARDIGKNKDLSAMAVQMKYASLPVAVHAYEKMSAAQRNLPGVHEVLADKAARNIDNIPADQIEDLKRRLDKIGLRPGFSLKPRQAREPAKPKKPKGQGYVFQ